MSVTRGMLLRSESYYLDMCTETSHYPLRFSASVIKTQDGLVASFSSSSAHTVPNGVWTVTLVARICPCTGEVSQVCEECVCERERGSEGE